MKPEAFFFQALIEGRRTFSARLEAGLACSVKCNQFVPNSTLRDTPLPWRTEALGKTWGSRVAFAIWTNYLSCPDGRKLCAQECLPKPPLFLIAARWNIWRRGWAERLWCFQTFCSTAREQHSTADRRKTRLLPELQHIGAIKTVADTNGEQYSSVYS